MGNFNPKLYLELIRSEIEISYPADVVAMIMERIVAVKAKMQIEPYVIVMILETVQRLRHEQGTNFVDLAFKPIVNLLASKQGTSSVNLALGKE